MQDSLQNTMARLNQENEELYHHLGTYQESARVMDAMIEQMKIENDALRTLVTEAIGTVGILVDCDISYQQELDLYTPLVEKARKIMRKPEEEKYS